MKKLIFIMMVFASWNFGFSQSQTGDNDKLLFLQILEDNRQSVDALVLYPEVTRNSIFLVSQYPETLIKMEQVQQWSSQKFTTLLAEYPREKQEIIWDLTRYDGLMEVLAINGPVVAPEFVAGYPVNVREDALRLTALDYELIVAVNGIQNEASTTFDQLLAPHPEAVVKAFRHLIELPEVLDLLTENIRLTILVGDVYKQDPEWVRQKMDSLNLIVARQQTKELEEWKASLEENPEVKAEMESFAMDYAEEQGYDEFYYDPAEDGFVEDYYPTVVEHHYHYPYWYGYPYWYTFPRWRPYPVWYDFGFYVRPGGYVVVFGLPSYYFSNWYFYNPYYFHHYPWVGAHFVNWWYYHPYSNTSVAVSARNWGKRNPEVVTQDWLANKGKRVTQMREYGKMEEARVSFNKKNPTRELTQTEYLERNNRKYPSLTTPVKPLPEKPALKPIERKETRPDVGFEKPMPPKVIPKPTVKPPIKPTVVPVKPPRVKPKKDNLQKFPPVYLPKVDKAREYHQQKWTKPPALPKVRPAPSVRPTITKKNVTKKKKN